MAAPPCEASKLIHFRNKIGEQSIELILKESILINGVDADDDNINVDNTVQEKTLHFLQMQDFTENSSKSEKK